MSHLSTIIDRVKRRMDSPDRAKDRLFIQSVCNLREYVLLWTNYTEEERKEAAILFIKYCDVLGEDELERICQAEGGNK